jgi:hypothetical protein
VRLRKANARLYTGRMEVLIFSGATIGFRVGDGVNRGAAGSLSSESHNADPLSINFSNGVFPNAHTA